MDPSSQMSTNWPLNFHCTRHYKFLAQEYDSVVFFCSVAITQCNRSTLIITTIIKIEYHSRLWLYGTNIDTILTFDPRSEFSIPLTDYIVPFVLLPGLEAKLNNILLPYVKKRNYNNVFSVTLILSYIN